MHTLSLGADPATVFQKYETDERTLQSFFNVSYVSTTTDPIN